MYEPLPQYRFELVFDPLPVWTFTGLPAPSLNVLGKW
jgi:hypothetical protein